MARPASNANGSTLKKRHAGDYISHFNLDSAKETKEDQQARLDNYTDVVNSYYTLATDLYEYGWGSSFHFARSVGSDTSVRPIRWAASSSDIIAR